MEAFGATWSGGDSGSDGGIGDGVDGDGDDYGSDDGGNVVGEGDDSDAGGVTTIRAYEDQITVNWGILSPWHMALYSSVELIWSSQCTLEVPTGNEPHLDYSRSWYRAKPGLMLPVPGQNDLSVGQMKPLLIQGRCHQLSLGCNMP